ncbi:integrase catalytic domain-containing protein [Nephila pilipes]|uniref:Integrase catalytic domain-containing protein n=1 Tax=Nephila pilipes TaxID=299642 RepID=A0A8X6QLU4_NEPPI|nr:integrase catalytic domain-containing protein [Nephila pilipes]
MRTVTRPLILNFKGTCSILTTGGPASASSNIIYVDEIVLLEDNNKRRSYWNLARVLKVIPGRDGQIRLALIKTENSELLRPVQRLYRLELENPVVKTGDEPIP